MPSNNAAILLSFLTTERTAVVGWIRRVVQSEAAAEDVTQNLWFRIQKVEDEPPIVNHRSFLFRLAKNLAVDHVRAEASRVTTSERAQAFLWAALDRPGPDQEAVDRDELSRVLAAASALPEPTKTIFRCSRFEGLKQREIAVRLGVSATTVENHMRRALALLSGVRDGG